jgi:SAM-dependent methyltransferase
MALTEHTHQHLTAHHRDFKAFAEAMVASHAGRFDETFWGFARQHAPSSVETIVDIGTGPGLLMPDLLKRFPGSTVYGVDGQPEMLVKARDLASTHPNAHVIAHDVSAGQTPELDAGVVDVVVASMVFHELPVPTTLLDESARLLRPGGLLLLSDWVRQPLAHYSDGKRPTDIDAFTHFSEHCRYTPEDVAWLVEKSGFKVVEWMARRNGRFVLLAAHRVATHPVVDGAQT